MKKSDQPNKADNTDSFLEELFYQEKYLEIINYFEDHQDELIKEPNYIEIVSRSYIEIKKYDEALKHINANIKLVKEKNLDDYAMFLIMKSEVMHYTNRPFKEYFILQKYKKLRVNENVDEILEKEVLFNIVVTLENYLYRIFNNFLYAIFFLSILMKFFSRIYFNDLINNIIISTSLLLLMLIVFNLLFEKKSRTIFFYIIKFFIPAVSSLPK